MKTAKNNELSFEVLLTSIYFLMTRYAKLPDEKISKAISEHLAMLSSHPDCDSEIIQKAGGRLAIQWREHLHDQDATFSKYKSFFPNQTRMNTH